MQNTGMQGSTPAAGRNEIGSGEASDRLGKLTDTAHHTIERLTQVAAQATSRLTPRVEQFMQSANVEKARIYMRTHPLAAIGIAIGVGLLLSRLFSRR